MRETFTATSLATLLVLLSTPALAQRDDAAAESLLAAGNVALAAGDLELACARFAEAQRLAPGPGPLGALATCHERKGLTGTAWAELVDAARQADGPLRMALVERARALEPSLSFLTIVVVSKGQPPIVSRDGKRVDPVRWGTPELVDPGVHTIDVQTGAADTRANVTERATIVVAPGQRARIEVPVRRDGPGASTQRVFGYVVTGLGLVAIATGIGYRIAASRTLASGPTCFDDSSCTGDPAWRASTVDEQRTIGAFSIGAGIALTAGGLALVMSAKDPPAPPPKGALVHVGGTF